MEQRFIIICLRRCDRLFISLPPQSTQVKHDLFLDVNGLAVKSGDLFIRGKKLSCVLSAAGRKQSRRQRWFFLSFFFFFLLFSFLFLHLLVMFSWQLLCTSNRLRITATCRMDASRSRGRMTRRILRIYMFARFPRLFPAGPISHLFPSLSLNWTFRWHWQSWGCRRKR